MKKQNTLTIAGQTFEIMPSIKNTDHSYSKALYGYDAIYHAYAKPSETKVRIWKNWMEWSCEQAMNSTPCELHISSYNSMQFTIGGFIRYKGITYKVRITRDHNRLYPTAI